MGDGERILAVDDQIENLELVDVLLSDAGYVVDRASDGHEALRVVAQRPPRVILLDIMMPGLDGFEVCRRLKTSRETYFIPVVMLTALSDIDSKVRGLEAGADDFLNKPINTFELLTRIRSLVRLQSLRDELDTTESVFLSMVAALERKLPRMRDHSLRVATLATRSARRAGLSPAQLDSVTWGALLHDIGKIGVPETVLAKRPSERTEKEQRLYEQHSLLGERILQPLASLRGACRIIRHHHERLDGSGYPDSLKGSAFSTPIEIVAAANAYEMERLDVPEDPDAWSRRLRRAGEAGRFRPEVVDLVLSVAHTLEEDALPEPAELLPVPSGSREGRIFVADDSETNREVVQAFLEDAGYEVRCFPRGNELLDAIRLEGEEPDLVLVDVRMPGVSGEQVCETLKSDDRWSFLPVILVTAYEGLANKHRALEIGADEFLSVPLNRQELIARVRSLLRLRSFHHDLVEQENVILSLSGVLEAKDPYTNGHSQRVGELAFLLASRMGLSVTDAERMRPAGLLHDIGKVAVPQVILHKNGPLTDEEFRVVQTHPVYGWEICRELRTAQPVLDCIRHHHERHDGTGYPDRLAGEDIPLPARIMGIVDALDALTSARPYRDGLGIDRAFQILEQEAGQGKWNPDVFAVLREMKGDALLHAVIETSRQVAVGGVGGE